MPGDFKPFEVEDSYYQTILNRVQEYFNVDGDWQFLEDAVTGEKMSVMEAIALGKK